MKKWNIGAYLRLSSDDGDKAESNSIGNQRNIIKQYINNSGLNCKINYYIDDGYSGTTFDRPDFKKLLDDIKDNKINCIVVKDLSRLGRNYIEVGKYIDEIFPSYNIRFIAINDNVDTYKDPKATNNVIVPFKNLMNDEYARDISQKVRSVLDNKKTNGQFIGSTAPYGYLRDPNNKYNFIIDKKASKVVKKVFTMILSGKSKKDVVEELNKMGIITPSEYKLEEGTYNYNYKGKSNVWTSKKLDDILKNRTYTGDLVQGKMKKVSHKVHKTLRVAENEWVIIPNHHKPLINKKDFEKVQELLYERNIRTTRKNNYDVFSGYLRCSKCGSNMILSAKRGVPRETISQGIDAELDSRLAEYGFPQEHISQIHDYVNGLDYSKPLHENWQATTGYLEQYGIPRKYTAAINSTVMHKNSLAHLDETLSSLDQGLTTRLPESMKLTRAVKGEYLMSQLQPGEDLTSLIGRRIEETGYSSTSPIYDTSFAKYDDYDVVYDIYAPKGTQGTSITPFSSYGTAEEEVLLNSNDLYITDVVPGVVDKNGRTKTVLKSVMLSKDKTCYKGIGGKEQTFTDIEHATKEELMAMREQAEQQEYRSYRDKLNEAYLAEKDPDTFLHSSFTMRDGETPKCDHYLEQIKGQERTVLSQKSFV